MQEPTKRPLLILRRFITVSQQISMSALVST